MATSSFDNTNLIIAPTYNRVFETNVQLRAFDVSGLNPADTVLVTGRTSIGDGYGGLYCWAPNKDNDDNNLTVIRPDMIDDTSNGRWIMINYNTPGPTGDKGATGDKGPKGDDGDVGPIGAPGPSGAYTDVIGSLKIYAGTTVPTGWLLCDGSSLLRASYPDLFAAIGTNFGSASSAEFNIPDLRGEFVRGYDAGRGVDTGRVFGSAQADSFKSHYHDLNGWTTQEYGYDGGDYGRVAGPDQSNVTQSTGGSETRPRNIAMNFIIKY